MDFELKTLAVAAAAGEKCDALVVLVTDTFKPASDTLGKRMATAQKAGDLDTKAGKLLQSYRCEGVAAPRLVFAGVGDGKARQVRTAVKAAIGALRLASVARITLVLPGALGDDEDALFAAMTSAADASYAYTTTRTKAEGRHLKRLTIAVADAARAQGTFAHAAATIKGIELAKEWGNRPANHATPTQLGEAAQQLSRLPKIRCEVLGPKEVAKLGMGSFMAVARGSEEPLRFIVLRYDGAPKDQAPVVLVGKGITFDSGGISMKPAAGMEEMKFDMCGAASVLGVFRALGELKPAINVVGLIASCENMPDGRSLKPGDVVTSMSGQTIEVINTDAEGRLLLCDALTYAQRFKPRAVVDIATLTGACIVALGTVRSGLFSPDDALAQALLDAGEAAQDLCWRMPLDADYAEGLQTQFADVANVGGRPGGAITAAAFLQRFADQYPWAHLDIAGTASTSGNSRCATGRPVGLLLAYLLSLEPQRAPARPAGSRSKRK